MLPEHFGHVTSTDAKHLTYVVAFKPASNILRKVLYCPILQMKTLRLKETGNSPTKTCCFTTITVSLIYSTPWTWFLDLQNYVVVQQMKWFLKEHMVLTSRLPVHHPVFGGRQEAPPLSGSQRLVPPLTVCVNTLRHFLLPCHHKEWLGTGQSLQRQRWPRAVWTKNSAFP